MKTDARGPLSKLGQLSDHSDTLVEGKTHGFCGVHQEYEAETKTLRALSSYQQLHPTPKPPPPNHRSFIKFTAVENILQAAEFAEVIERPLRHHLIIRWPTDDWSLHQPVQQAMGKWLSRYSGGAFYVWAKEGNGGPHSHFLLYLEPNRTRRFRSMLIRTLKRLTGLRSLNKGTVRCRNVFTFGSPTEHTQNRVAYICKGADPETRKLLGIEKTDICYLPGGKQAGVSQSLGIAAREGALRRAAERAEATPRTEAEWEGADQDEAKKYVDSLIEREGVTPSEPERNKLIEDRVQWRKSPRSRL